MKMNFLLKAALALLVCATAAPTSASAAEAVIWRACNVGAIFGSMITTAQAIHFYLQKKQAQALLAKEIARIKKSSKTDDQKELLAYLESEYQAHEVTLASPCAFIFMKALQGALVGCLGALAFVKILKEDKREKNKGSWFADKVDKVKTLAHQKLDLNQNDYDLAAAFGGAFTTCSFF